MKRGIDVWLGIVLAGFIILSTGCSPTGWAVREVPDGTDLQPGNNVTVFQHDGSVVTGEFISSATIPSADYITQYNRVAESRVRGKMLPAIGQTVQLTTTLSDAKFWTGELVGFDLENIWLRFSGKDESEPVYFSSINSLSDGNGGVIRRTMLRNLFLSGDIPLMSSLKLKNAHGEFHIPISSIRTIVVASTTASQTTLDGSQLRAMYLP